MVEEIKFVHFGISGDADVLNASACLVHKLTLTTEHGTLYDPRMGCVRNDARCETCSGTMWTCPGHFGHIDLVVPVILFHKQTIALLKCFCVSCHRLIATSREIALNELVGYDRIVPYLESLSSCAHCKTPVPDVRYNAADCSITATHKLKHKKATREWTASFVKTVFDSVSDEDVRLLGLDPTMTRPSNYVLTKFPVLPTCCRPKMTAGDTVNDDDLTLILLDLLKANCYLMNNPWEAARTEQETAAYRKAVATIQTKALAYCDNSRGKATHTTNHKPMTGIKERINRKTGLVRQNLTGKRVDMTSRTVIGPDASLKIDEIALPREVADALTIPEYVTPLNAAALSETVNGGAASTVVRRDGTRVNVAYARIERGTKLEHGDRIVRSNDETIDVADCSTELRKGDRVVKADGRIVPARLPKTRRVELNIGDVVERYLRTGDAVYLNRQPTLHRNGMLGMRVVVKPGRTIRFNLSITKGLNADFDGDEGNVFCCETLESAAEMRYVVGVKERMLSAQANKPEQVFVQDSALGAYLMTRRSRPMSPDDFMNCLLTTSAASRFRPASSYSSVDLFSYLLPTDFYASYPPPSNLTIDGGRIVRGYFDKASLGGSKNAIVRLLRMEYGKETAADFVDNLQFVTNAWLKINGFSIGVDDCLAKDPSRLKATRDVVDKYFEEAEVVRKTVRDVDVREAKINSSLNKAKDIGMRIAKEALSADNGFVKTVESGSKGDYFNIAQITGLLGQQNIDNRRPKATLTNGSRSLVHYPHVLVDRERTYESAGFVRSSFLGGLNPKETWFHATTGREGMISTAMKTASSGYLQRSSIKLNEDLRVEYDGTVRDARGFIHQFEYGNQGFDPSLVTYDPRDGLGRPVDVVRLARRSNAASRDRSKPKRAFDADWIEETVAACEWKCQIPREIHDSIWSRHAEALRRDLRRVSLIDDADVRSAFRATVVEKYATARSCPGEAVGILSALSIGEVQTQTNLNTFHTAGKIQSSGVERFDELLNMPKTPKYPSMTVRFRRRFESFEALRAAIGSSIVSLSFDDVVVSPEPTVERDEWGRRRLRYRLKLSTLFAYRLSPETVLRAIRTEHGDVETVCGATSVTLIVDDRAVTARAAPSDRRDKWVDTDPYSRFLTAIGSTKICGIDRVESMSVVRSDDGECYAITRGSNLRKLLIHPLIDVRRSYSNDVWETYRCLGIAATRRNLLDDMRSVVGPGVNDCHLSLLVDKMTVRGRPMSITRYTMRSNAVGPLSKATFEQSVDFVLNAAFRGERDDIDGVSSSIVVGNRPKIGTGFFDVMIDTRKLRESGNEGRRKIADEPPTTYYY